jgi:hypothetical protein
MLLKNIMEFKLKYWQKDAVQIDNTAYKSLKK